MNEQLRRKLTDLRTDFETERGTPFSNFFCPLLFVDDNTNLCKAHVVNQAFAGSARKWTVQRHDIDSWYGANFEAGFVDAERLRPLTPTAVFNDTGLAKRIKPRLYHNKAVVDYYHCKGEVPKQFPRVTVDGSLLPVAIKMDRAQVVATGGKGWEAEFSCDLRIPSVVSIIKSAYLTMFDILGYRYALSAAGSQVGRDILGSFFQRNHGRSKSEVLSGAAEFFREYVHMVRPLIANSVGLRGSITDRLFLLCGSGSGNPWAIIVFVRTGATLHAALLPIYDNLEQGLTYLKFLRNQNSDIRAAMCRFDGDSWTIDTNTVGLVWPKVGVSLVDGL